MTTIGKVRKYSNPDIAIAGLLVTRRANRAIATRDLIEAIHSNAAALQLHVYASIVREAVAIRESQIMQQSIFDTAPKAKVTDDYSKFIDEYLSQGRA